MGSCFSFTTKTSSVWLFIWKMFWTDWRSNPLKPNDLVCVAHTLLQTQISGLWQEDSAMSVDMTVSILFFNTFLSWCELVSFIMKNSFSVLFTVLMFYNNSKISPSQTPLKKGQAFSQGRTNFRSLPIKYEYLKW